MTNDDQGVTPFDKLQHHYDVDMTCPECGYTDEEGAWQAETDGGTVHYRHVCPSCGEIRKRTVEVGDHE